MKNIDNIRPTTVDGVKRLAKQIGKTRNVPHHEALDLAALQGGWQNYRHALKALQKENQ